MTEAIKRHFAKDELLNMTVEDLAELIGVLPQGAKFEAKAAVFDKNGNPKYDDPSKRGEFDEI